MEACNFLHDLLKRAVGREVRCFPYLTKRSPPFFSDSCFRALLRSPPLQLFYDRCPRHQDAVPPSIYFLPGRRPASPLIPPLVLRVFLRYWESHCTRHPDAIDLCFFRSPWPSPALLPAHSISVHCRGGDTKPSNFLPHPDTIPRFTSLG